MAGARRRSWWGWGYEDQRLTGSQAEALGKLVAARLGVSELVERQPPDLDDLEIPPPRVFPPTSIEPFVSTERYERASHAYGKSFRDVIRALSGVLEHPPDLVAFPGNETEVAAILDWCTTSRIAVVPYGGGSSVVGGVECDVGDDFAGAVSLDLSRLGKVVEVDRVSRAACIEAGAFGPALEDQLRPHGLTLRHFPQSFEHSTLGGWIATRSGGHYATNYTHIDDFVESLRVLTSAGIVETRRLPGSGAGPSPERLFLGSEGTLGVITRAWMRLQDRPRWRTSAGVRFPSFEAGVEATRAISQAALFPANCRLLDPTEAATSAGVTDGSALLVVGFESADHPVDTLMARALECCLEYGGSTPEGVRSSSDTGSAGTWRAAFLAAPYVRDALACFGIIAETFETACCWDRFEELHASVMESVSEALVSVCGGGILTCRFTHVYPDGPAPYFTVLAPGRPGAELDQWDTIKEVASEAVTAHGGTITHHHSVGRVHRPFYDRERPEPFAAALRAVKDVLDPAGVMNPGVLIDP